MRQHSPGQSTVIRPGRTALGPGDDVIENSLAPLLAKHLGPQGGVLLRYRSTPTRDSA